MKLWRKRGRQVSQLFTSTALLHLWPEFLCETMEEAGTASEPAFYQLGPVTYVAGVLVGNDGCPKNLFLYNF